MKFLVDAQLPPALATWLVKAGHEAVALREIGLRDAPDQEICSFALAKGYIIVTKDEDYAALARTRPGLRILWVRIGNVVNRVLLAAFAAKWTEIVGYLESGNPVVVLR
jgi:predicted nuclease of predicted toxin-antitoxin system